MNALQTDRGDGSLPAARVCEDCGDPVTRRRLRCPACRKLVCGWCFGHVHNRAERMMPPAVQPPETP